MTEFIYYPLAALGETGIIWAVVVLLVLLFLSGLVSTKFRQVAPALMTSLGIFGTFCGIFIALYPLDFSPGQMNDSIEALLNGMRTAFVTSLLGIGSSIIFRIVGAPMSDSVNSLLSRLMTREPPSPTEHGEILDRLDAIKQAIAGDGDSSMVTQMQKMRDENRDGFKKLDGLSEAIHAAIVENLGNLIVEIREIIGKQLGDSLKQLIENIEEALIKQFGSTFVEFNAATQAIKKWQEDHREQVEQLTNAFSLTAEQISQIASDCQTIPATMEQLRETTIIAREDVNLLNQQLVAFERMREQAQEAFPTIKQHLDKIGADLAQSAQGFDGLKTTIQQAEEETRRIARLHTQNIEALATGMRETLEEAQRASADKVVGIVDDAINNFTQEINREITRVAVAWGENMVGIAERVAEAISKEGQRQ